MITLITYDITDHKRLIKLNKFLKDYGFNTQKSVFECNIDDADMKAIRDYCREYLDLETDSVRIYRICSGCLNRVILLGKGVKVTQLEYVIV